jgi:hypothetical protein
MLHPLSKHMVRSLAFNSKKGISEYLFWLYYFKVHLYVNVIKFMLINVNKYAIYNLKHNLI